MLKPLRAQVINLLINLKVLLIETKGKKYRKMLRILYLFLEAIWMSQGQRLSISKEVVLSKSLFIMPAANTMREKSFLQ